MSRMIYADEKMYFIYEIQNENTSQSRLAEYDLDEEVFREIEFSAKARSIWYQWTKGR